MQKILYGQFLTLSLAFSVVRGNALIHVPPGSIYLHLYTYLAEFIIMLGETNGTLGKFKAALKQNGAEFPVSLFCYVLAFEIFIYLVVLLILFSANEKRHKLDLSCHNSPRSVHIISSSRR